MSLAPYHCAACKLAVIVLPGAKPIRACTCQAPIVALMEATVSAHGGVRQEEAKGDARGPA